MAQVKLLKIASDGIALENSASDDITFASFSVSGGGPVLSGTGLNLNSQQISNVTNILFSNPATGYLNATAGNLIIDNLMAKDRDNVMSVSGGGILFPVVTNTGAALDAFRMPAVSGAPSATPTNTGTGFLVWDSLNNKEWAWNGTAWVDLSIATSATNIDDNSYNAAGTINVRDVVYISAADTLAQANGGAVATSTAIGFAVNAATVGQPVTVRCIGQLSGFSGLTAGAREYLSPSTAGTITETLPVGTGNTIVMMGYAKNSTTVQIQIKQLGRRA